MSGKVTVTGTTVTISLSDETTGELATKTLNMSAPDTSSAEWIAEAPAAASGDGSMSILPLADFGKVTFTSASASAGGHTGSISDPDWSVERIDLNSSAATGDSAGFGGLSGESQQAGAGATTGSVSDDGSTFTVSYAAAPGSDVSSAYGYPGDGYGGYGPYGDDGGYGVYPEGWSVPGV
jgi:Peptidase A4 family